MLTQLTSTAIRVGVPPAADTRFSAGIIVQSEQVTCREGRGRRVTFVALPSSVSVARVVCQWETR